MLKIRFAAFAAVILAAVASLASAQQATQAGVGAAIPDGKIAVINTQAFPDGSQGIVTIKMTHHGHRIESFEITWLAPCDSGFTTLSQGTHAQGSVTRRGRFRGHGSYTSNMGNLAGTQYTATVSDRLGGIFVGKTKAKGAFQATAVLHDAGGQAVSTCTSPTITWRAKHL